MKYPVALTCGALWLASVSSLAWAADVPPGTVLAENVFMLALGKKLGFTIEQGDDRSEFKLTIDLTTVKL